MDDFQVRTCVNGTLFSLLKRRAIKEEASRSGLEEKIVELMQDCDENLRSQFQCVLEEMRTDLTEEDEEVEGDEEINEETEAAYDEEDSLNEEIYTIYYKVMKEFLFEDREVGEEERMNVGTFMNQQVLSERSKLLNMSINATNNDNSKMLSMINVKNEGDLVISGERRG